MHQLGSELIDLLEAFEDLHALHLLPFSFNVSIAFAVHYPRRIFLVMTNDKIE